MASWTDTPQLLTQFNEYTPQQPIDAMVAVGQTRQQRYDEGVQRIQQQIDRVAGIDIVKDADKKYLQSKLNQLNTDLKKVAAGDFSNYQLTNSVGGMINGIAKDKTVQNAAYSTAWYRKQLSKMEKDAEEGKSNPANIEYFNKKANSWLSSDKPGEKFNSEYVPYFDVFKFAKETFDAVKPDGYSFDQIYQTNSDGTPLLDNRGRPIASPIMKTLEKEGLFPEKVQATINQIFSDPRVDTQLSISGEYSLGQVSPENLSTRILNQKDKLLKDINGQIGLLQIQKNTGKDVQGVIDQLTLQANNLKTKYDEFSNLALTNPDFVRASLYKDDVKNNFTSMFSWMKTKEQTKDNPLWNANFKLNQEANRIAEFRERMDFEKGKEQWDRQFKTLELNLKQQNEAKKAKGGIDPEFTQDFQESEEIRYISEFDNKYIQAAEQYSDASNEFIYNLKYGSNEKADKEIESLISAGNSRNKAISIFLDKEFTDDQGKEFWELESLKEYNLTSPEWREANSSKVDAYNNYVKSKTVFEDAKFMKDEVTRRIGTLGIDEEALKSLIKPTSITVNGEKVDITSEDMYNAAIYLKGNESVLPFIDTPSSVRDAARKAKEILKQRGKEFLIDYVASRSEQFTPLIEGSDITGNIGPITNITRFFTANNPFQPGLQNVNEFNDQFRKIYKAIDNDQLGKQLKAKSEIIKEMGFSVAPNLRAEIFTGNTEKDTDLSRKILNTAANYNQNKQQLSSDFDYSDWESILATKDPKTVVLKTRMENGKVIPTLVGYKDGKQLTSMVLSAEELRNITEIEASSIYESEEIKGLRNRINASPRGSTSIGDPNQKETYMYGDAYFQKAKMDFPKLGNYGPDVMANLKMRNGKVYPIIFVYDGEQMKVRELGGEADIPEALKNLRENVTPQFVNSILTEQ